MTTKSCHLERECARFVVGVCQVVEVKSAESEAHLVDVCRVQRGSRWVELCTGHSHEFTPGDVHSLPVPCKDIVAVIEDISCVELNQLL